MNNNKPDIPRVPIHIFTDSKYTYNASTSQTLRGANFYLAQEVQNLGHRLKTAHNIPYPSIHFLPSHIEHTAQGVKHTGNFYADRLASIGRHMSNPNDKSRYLHTIRMSLLSGTIDIIDAIENILYQKEQEISCEPDGPSAGADDLSAPRLCRPGLSVHGSPAT